MNMTSYINEAKTIGYLSGIAQYYKNAPKHKQLREELLELVDSMEKDGIDFDDILKAIIPPYEAEKKIGYANTQISEA